MNTTMREGASSGMKILLINDYGSPIGGAEVLTFALRDELRRLGHDVRLFASSAGASQASSEADYLCYGTLSRFRTLLQTLNPWAFVRLRRVLQEFQPDVVHVRMFFTQLSPLILPLLRRVPALYHVVWYRPICLTGTKLLPTGSPCQSPVRALSDSPVTGTPVCHCGTGFLCNFKCGSGGSGDMSLGESSQTVARCKNA